MPDFTSASPLPNIKRIARNLIDKIKNSVSNYSEFVFLDSSCGYGSFLLQLNGLKTIGCDIDEKAVQIAKLKDKQAPTKEELQTIIGDVIKEVNKKLPKYKNIRDFDIREIEFVKTTTAKIKRQANLEEDKAPQEAAQEAEEATQNN